MGALLGFVIALVYYGFMNSVLANGQTIGKRVMKIRVTGLNGAAISVPRSFVRYLILGTPFFLNGAAIPPRTIDSWIGTLIAIIIFGVGGSIVYLFIFNRRNRRSLHDIMAVTCVARIDAAAEAAPNLKIWFGHGIVISLFIVIMVGCSFALKKFAERWGYKELVGLQSTLMEEPNIWYAAVFSGKGFKANSGGITPSTTTAVGVWVSRAADNYDALANRVAEITLNKFPNAESGNRLVVTVTYGYDLGLATTHTSRLYDYSPSEWHTRLENH